ncbi:MAG: DUF3343 domain-containing protein [Clostridia bacterium]|nr:DUF3343 domain-containing protein [Clostridia bacterium]
MNSSEYLAVFKSLSYAGRVKNEFILSKRPKIIKTPKRILGGCSYSLLFPKEQLFDMKQAVKRHKRGLIGIYRQTEPDRYEVISYDLP